MTAEDLKKSYLDFFVDKNHKILPNLSLVPENDPTTLFISAGMQPLVPYLLGEPHPLGKKLVSLQRCLRTGDIDMVGDSSHLTFFEMLGNWSLGDYWKKESLSFSFEFLTRVLGLDHRKLHVTIFAGDEQVPKDEESERTWRSLGIPSERIYPLGRKDNWWEAGSAGPGGPDSEIFYDTGKPPCGPNCHPGDNCGRFFEMWNNVFMEYNRKKDGTYEKLMQRNVDTGMGVERTTPVLEGKGDVYQTELFSPIIQVIADLSKKRYEGEPCRAIRIIADHIRASVFLIADGIYPSNVDRGYVLRRLIRRSIRFGKALRLIKVFTPDVARVIIELMNNEYPKLKEVENQIIETLAIEEEKFRRALEQGLREIEKYQALDGRVAFYLYQTYGFPMEMTRDIALERGQKIDEKIFEEEFTKHQAVSKKGVVKKFTGGLANRSEEVVKLHTATHLLHKALREVLGTHVQQVGSHITPERLRFDFTHLSKLTRVEISKIEDLVNKKIKADLPVKMEIMTLNKALSQRALAFFGEKYGEKVKVYSIGEYSKEVCGGPHAKSTGELKGFKIIKEEAIGSGRQRIYAKLI